MERILKASIDLFDRYEIQEKHVLVDTTVQEKNITYPTDPKLPLDNMLLGIPDGLGTNDTSETLRKIQKFTRQFLTVYLSTHDPESAQRMDHQIIVPLFEEAYDFVNA